MKKATHENITGNIIRASLVRRGMDMNDLSKRTGIPARTIYRWMEKPEEMRMRLFSAIVRATDMAPEDVMEITRQMH